MKLRSNSQNEANIIKNPDPVISEVYKFFRTNQLNLIFQTVL